MGLNGRRKKVAPATILLLVLSAAVWFFSGNRQPGADFSAEAPVQVQESSRAGNVRQDAGPALSAQGVVAPSVQGVVAPFGQGVSAPFGQGVSAPSVQGGPGEKASVFGQVQDVPDGDSLVVLLPNGRRERVRLYGIDAPEGAQEGGKAARNFSAGLCMNARVKVEEQYRDQYNRIVGIVTLPGGRVLNAELLRAGHAWVYYQYCESPWKEAWLPLQKEAKARKAGLWGGATPLEPWQWRKQHPR